MTDTSLLLQFLVISPLLIVSLVLHELAHGWVAYRARATRRPRRTVA